MTPETVVELGQQAIQTLLILSAPLMLAALGIGLVIGIIQAATQINEQTLTFVPKLFGILLILGLGGGWMIQTAVDYTRALILQIPSLAG